MDCHKSCSDTQEADASLSRSVPQGLSNTSEAADEKPCHTHSVEQDDSHGRGLAMPLARLIVLLAVLWTGIFFPVLDETMIATILGPISATFNSFSKLSWIATSYVIGMSASTPVSGHMTDIFGRKYGYIVVSGVFAVGTLVCGLSHSLPVLLFGRALAGVGGGSMGSITAFIEADLVSLRNRGITEGIGGIVYGVAIAVGGVFGGGINDSVGWRWSFLVQVPIMAVIIAVAWILIKIPTRTSALPTLRRIDFVGGTALIAGIVLLQLGLQSGEEYSDWSMPIVLSCIPLSVLCFVVVFVWDTKFAPEPVLPVRQLMGRNLLLSCIFYLFELMSYMTLEFYVPIYLQVLGLSTTQVGLRFLPQAVCAALATFLAGMWVKLRGTWYWMNVAIQGCNILGSGLMLLLTDESPGWYPFVFLALSGIGFGGSWVTVMMAVLSTVDNKDQATVQSAGYLLRTVGMTLGLVLGSVTFQRVFSNHLWETFSDRPGGADIVDRLLHDFKSLQELDESSKASAQGAYIVGLRGVFWLTFGESLVAALASLCMKEYEIPASLRG